ALGKPALFQYEVVDAAAGCERLLGDRRRALIPEDGVESGDDPDGIFHVVRTVLAVGGDAADAAIGENDGGVFQEHHATEKIVNDDRFSHVELELARLGSHGDGEIRADDLIADLVDDFGKD